MTKRFGAGLGAGIAATWRTRGDYRTAAIIENFYGERRVWGLRGETMHQAFPPPCDEFSKRVFGGAPEYEERDYRG